MTTAPRPVRRPPRLLALEVGPLTFLALAVAYAALWLVARPANTPTVSYIGQWCGAESILLLSVALVLISTLPWVEMWFYGIDRAAVWHRRVAMIGLVLLLSTGAGGGGRPLGIVGLLGLPVLVVWAVLPRWQSILPRPLRKVVLITRDAPGGAQLRGVLGGYERWRGLYRTTGLFVAAGFAHGLLDGTPFGGALVPRDGAVAIIRFCRGLRLEAQAQAVMRVRSAPGFFCRYRRLPNPEQAVGCRFVGRDRLARSNRTGRVPAHKRPRRAEHRSLSRWRLRTSPGLVHHIAAVRRQPALVTCRGKGFMVLHFANKAHPLG